MRLVIVVVITVVVYGLMCCDRRLISCKAFLIELKLEIFRVSKWGLSYIGCRYNGQGNCRGCDVSRP